LWGPLELHTSNSHAPSPVLSVLPSFSTNVSTCIQNLNSCVDDTRRKHTAVANIFWPHTKTWLARCSCCVYICMFPFLPFPLTPVPRILSISSFIFPFSYVIHLLSRSVTFMLISALILYLMIITITIAFK
jgi:hypothetical protein